MGLLNHVQFQVEQVVWEVVGSSPYFVWPHKVLRRIQLRSVRRQPFDPESSVSRPGLAGFHLLRDSWRPAVQHFDQPTAQIALHLSQKSFDIFRRRVTFVHSEVQPDSLPVGRRVRGASHAQKVLRIPGVHRPRTSRRDPNLAHRWVKGIRPVSSRHMRLRPVFRVLYAQPLLATPPRDGLFGPLVSVMLMLLATPSQRVKNVPNNTGIVDHDESHQDHLRHPPQRPQVRRVSVLPRLAATCPEASVADLATLIAGSGATSPPRHPPFQPFRSASREPVFGKYHSQPVRRGSGDLLTRRRNS